jgi:acetyl esterase/lipase
VTETVLRLVDRSRPTVSRGVVLARFRPLVTLVWSPAAPGRWPLVVFAHGFQVGPAPYVSLLRAWASHGYVVAAPEFPLTDQALAGSHLDENDIQNQPADVRFVTDELVAVGSPLEARIDRSRVAVAGHSDGAQTAEAASEIPPPPGEPTYRAAIVMSSQPLLQAFGPTPPILITQGDVDTINQPWKGYATFAAAGRPKYLLVLHHGTHLDPLLAGSAWLPGVEAVTEAFLDAYVAGGTPVSAVASAVPRSGLFTLRSG